MLQRVRSNSLRDSPDVHAALSPAFVSGVLGDFSKQRQKPTSVDAGQLPPAAIRNKFHDASAQKPILGKLGLEKNILVLVIGLSMASPGCNWPAPLPASCLQAHILCSGSLPSNKITPPNKGVGVLAQLSTFAASAPVVPLAGAACKRSRSSSLNAGNPKAAQLNAAYDKNALPPNSKLPRTSGVDHVHAAAPGEAGVSQVHTSQTSQRRAADSHQLTGGHGAAQQTAQLPPISTLRTALSMTDSVLHSSSSSSHSATHQGSAPAGMSPAADTAPPPDNQAAGISPFALQAAQAQFQACAQHEGAQAGKRAPASSLETREAEAASNEQRSAHKSPDATAQAQPTRTRPKRRAALRAVQRLGDAGGGVSPPPGSIADTLGVAAASNAAECGGVTGTLAQEVAAQTEEVQPAYWRKHIFVKLLFVSSRAISNQLVSGRSQIGWAVILPAEDALHSLSYRQRSELVRCNGSKVAIRYLLASHEKESVRGLTRQGRMQGGKQYMAMTAAWFDVIDVEAIVAAGTDLFALHPSFTAEAGYPVFECLTA